MVIDVTAATPRGGSRSSPCPSIPEDMTPIPLSRLRFCVFWPLLTFHLLYDIMVRRGRGEIGKALVSSVKTTHNGGSIFGISSSGAGSTVTPSPHKQLRQGVMQDSGANPVSCANTSVVCESSSGFPVAMEIRDGDRSRNSRSCPPPPPPSRKGPTARTEDVNDDLEPFESVLVSSFVVVCRGHIFMSNFASGFHGCS